MAVLNIGGMNVNDKPKAVGVGDDVPLTGVNTFAGIVASRTAGLGRRCALTVNDRCRWSGLASKLPAGLADQSSDDFLPPSGIAPSIKIALNRRVRRKILRQSSPLTPAGQNEEDRLHDLAQIPLPWPAPMTLRRHPPTNQRPLRIRHIACVAQPTASILRTRDFSPWHGALPRIFANPKESQPAEITHCFFGQALRMREEYAEADCGFDHSPVDRVSCAEHARRAAR